MSDTIKVLLIKPMKPPEVAEIPSGLKGSQATVGGYIEAIYSDDEDFCFCGICINPCESCERKASCSDGIK